MTDTLIALTVIVAFVALAWLVEHAHRVHEGRPHAPWGADARDSDLTRVLRDLDAHP